MYNSYHNTAEAQTLLYKLPAFITKNVDSSLYKLLNPYAIYAEQFYQDCIDLKYNINPLSSDYGLPGFLFVAIEIDAGLVPYTSEATLVQAVDLNNFYTGYPTGVTFDAANETSWTNNNSEDVIDAHFVSPLYYKDTDGKIQTLDAGFYILHEGIYISDHLIAIYDDEWTYITTVSLDSILQKGSDLRSDEWVENIGAYCDGTDIDPSLGSTACGIAGGTYKIDNFYLKNKYLVKDSLRVINPLVFGADGLALEISDGDYTVVHEIPAGETQYTTYLEFSETVTDSAGNTYSIHDVQLIVEYRYLPSLLISSLTFLNNVHSVHKMARVNAYPLTFSYIDNNSYELNSGSVGSLGYEADQPYSFTGSNNELNVNIKSDETVLNGTTLESMLVVNGHEAREGVTVKETGVYTLEFTEDFTFNAGDIVLSTSSLLSFDDMRSVEFRIISTSAPATNYNGLEIMISVNDFEFSFNKGSFAVTRLRNLQYEHAEGAYTDIVTTVALTAEVNIEHSVSTVVSRYTKPSTDILKVITPSSTEEFYLTYPFASSLVVDVGSVVSTTADQRLIVLDTSGLSADDLIISEYNAYSSFYTKDDRQWYQSMIDHDIDLAATFPDCTYISRQVSVSRVVVGCNSLAWFNRALHLEEESFSKTLISLDKSDNTLHYYDATSTYLDKRLLGGTEVEVAGPDATINTYYRTDTNSNPGICIRYFENTIIILYSHIPFDGANILNAAQNYTLTAYDVDTLAELWTKDIDVGAIKKINSFTIDKEHNIILVDSDGALFTATFDYNYYMILDNGSQGASFNHYFRHKYTDLVFKDLSSVIQMSNGDEPVWDAGTLTDVTIDNDFDFPVTTPVGTTVSKVQITSSYPIDPTMYTYTDSTLKILADPFTEATISQSDATGSSATADASAWTITLNLAGLANSEIISSEGALAGPIAVTYDNVSGVVTIAAGAVGIDEIVTISWKAQLLLSNGDTLQVTWSFTSNDFGFEERILNYSTDQLGRVVGSDRWWGESGLSYAKRIKNITNTDGDVSKELAIAGMSATLNAPSYKTNNFSNFSLSFPLKAGEAANTIVTLKGRYDFWNSTLTDFNGDGTIDASGGDDGTTLVYTTHYTIEDSAFTGGRAGILSILDTNGVADEEIEGEIIYKSNLLDKSGENIMITEYFTYTNYTQPQNYSDIITINSLADESYINSYEIVRDGKESTGIYNSTLIKYLVKGGANFKFKWNEFEWDHYEWADGATIVNGLPTYFDGITCKPYTDIDPALQMFDNGVSGKALKYLGKDESGIPLLHNGSFYYLDSEYNLYIEPQELLLDPGNYPIGGTWHDGEWTPLVYFIDTTGNGSVDAATYLQPGSAAPVVANNEVSALAMSIAPGDTGMNELGVSSETITMTAGAVDVSFTTPAGNFAQASDQSYVYEVYKIIDVGTNQVTLLIEDTDYIIDISGGTLTSLLSTNEDFMLVYNSSTFLNSYYLNPNKPENSIMRLNRMSSINFAQTDNLNEIQVMTDTVKAKQHEDLTGLPNPFSESTIQTVISNSVAPDLTNNEFYFRDAATDGSRPWVTNDWDNDTCDVRLDGMGTSGIFKLLFDTSYGNKIKVLAGEGPQLDHKNFNIGNTLLVVGRVGLDIQTVDIQASKTIVGLTDTLYLFVKLLDTENGRVPSKTIVASTLNANVSLQTESQSTKEDGIAILKVDLEVTSTLAAGALIQIDIESISDDENWGNSINLTLSDSF